MKFVGVNSLRINKETVMKALAESFDSSLISNDVVPIKMTYHENGDITLVFAPHSHVAQLKAATAQGKGSEQA